jgi:sarcosine oxidase subunit alpha
LVALYVNGRAVTAPVGTSVAVALMTHGVTAFRRSVTGEPRAPLCGMGICFECRVAIDGRAHQKACQIVVAPGMAVVTDE